MCMRRSTKRVSKEEYRARFQKAHPDYRLLSDYVNSVTKVKAQCRCGHTWDVDPRTILKRGCPECGKKKAAATVKWQVTQEQYVSKLQERAPNVEAIGQYVSCWTKIEVRCRLCSHSWYASPTRLYKGHGYGCAKCGRRKQTLAVRKNPEIFAQEFAEYHQNRLVLLDTYVASHLPVRVRCSKCEHSWSSPARRLLRRGCPNCKYSKGEIKIESILKENGIRYKKQFMFSELKSPKGCCLRFDFAIFNGDKLSHLIEYDGVQHFVPLKHLGGKARFDKDQYYDHLKNEFCKTKGLKLLRIPYTKFDDLTLDMLEVSP